MTHNRFDVYDDIIQPLKNFLAEDVYSNSDDEDEFVDNFGAASMHNIFLKSIQKISLPNLHAVTKKSAPKFAEEFFIPPKRKKVAPMIQVKMRKSIVI